MIISIKLQIILMTDYFTLFCDRKITDLYYAVKYREYIFEDEEKNILETLANQTEERKNIFLQHIIKYLFEEIYEKYNETTYVLPIKFKKLYKLYIFANGKHIKLENLLEDADNFVKNYHLFDDEFSFIDQYYMRRCVIKIYQIMEDIYKNYMNIKFFILDKTIIPTELIEEILDFTNS